LTKLKYSNCNHIKKGERLDKKKILITTDTYLPRQDEISSFLSKLVPHIKDQYDITIIAPKFDGKVQKTEGVKLIRLPILNIKFGDTYFSFKTKEISKYVAESDLVFNNTIGPIGQAAINAAKKHDKPAISYIHSIEWEAAAGAVKRMKWLTETLTKRRAQKNYNKCSLLLTPTKETEDILTAHGINTTKITVETGIEPELYKPALSKTEAKKKIGIDPKYTVIGYAGRIGREKDLPTLAHAFMRVNKKYKNTLLIIVGDGITDEIPNHIKILKIGGKQKILPYLQAMDIFVLPSLTETIPRTTLEAMSTGIPVITTPVGCMKDCIKDEENGLIFPRGDVTALADKIEMLIEDPKMRELFGGKARQTVKEKYRWEETVSRMKRVLEKV
jgi:glycosyltransferase involved in cell wall biosynthesis